jgi:hypothetical protein
MFASLIRAGFTFALIILFYKLLDRRELATADETQNYFEILDYRSDTVKKTKKTLF